MAIAKQSLKKAACNWNLEMISIKDLSTRYEVDGAPITVLSKINLDIGEGEFISLIGPTGCGKTTLLKAIAGLVEINDGTLSVDDLTPEQARIQNRYGYVFQSPALLPWRSVEDNIRLPLQIKKYSKDEIAKRIEQALSLVKLTEFRDRFPHQLSGGMKQRVSIARALSFDAPILLMDEPFAALDEISRTALNQELLSIWKKTGKTIVFVTHSIPEAVFLSQRIVTLSPSPGQVSAITKSKLGEKRTSKTVESKAFLQTANTVRKHLENA